MSPQSCIREQSWCRHLDAGGNWKSDQSLQIGYLIQFVPNTILNRPNIQFECSDDLRPYVFSAHLKQEKGTLSSGRVVDTTLSYSQGDSMDTQLIPMAVRKKRRSPAHRKPSSDRGHGGKVKASRCRNSRGHGPNIADPVRAAPSAKITNYTGRSLGEGRLGQEERRR